MFSAGTSRSPDAYSDSVSSEPIYVSQHWLGDSRQRLGYGYVLSDLVIILGLSRTFDTAGKVFMRRRLAGSRLYRRSTPTDLSGPATSTKGMAAIVIGTPDGPANSPAV